MSYHPALQRYEASRLVVACVVARAPQRQDDPGVSRGSTLDDDGSVFSPELDPDLLPHDAATRDAARPPWLARTEVLVDRGPGYARLSGGACFADAKRAAA